MLKNYIKTALRNLLRNKVYSFINIVGLSLGLASVMLIILYLKDEISYDRFHVQADRIYRIVLGQAGPNATSTEKMGITGFIQGPKFASKIPEIKSFVRLSGGYEDMKIGTDVKGQQLLFADSNFFSVFSFPLLNGDPKTVLLQPNTVVLSEDIALRQFGTTDAVGKTVLLKKGDLFVPYLVSGVSKRCPQNSSIQFDVLLPFSEPPGVSNQPSNWFSFFLTTYVVVASHADIKATEAKMTKVYKEDGKEMIESLEKKYKVQDPTVYMLQPLLDVHLGKDVSQEDIVHASDPMFSYVLSGIAFFILFIACVNFVNLSVARSLKRAKEIGIRKVAGGSRQQLIFQFLGESFALCSGAFILAIVIVTATLPLFNQLSNKSLSLSYLLDFKLVAGYFILFITTGLMAGFYPALVLSGYKPVQTLYNRFTLTGKNYLQKCLVVLQFTLASFLIIATFTIFSQFKFLTNKKLGYDDSNLIMVNKSRLTRNEARFLRSTLIKDPNIIEMAAKDEGYSFNEAKINGNIGLGFANVTVDESYLPLLKIHIIQGRNFSRDFPSDSAHSVIVNETFVKKAGWKTPIGQLVGYGDSKFSVIGVVKDYHFQSLSQEIVPEMFSMTMQNDYGMAYIKIRPGSEAASLKFIEKMYKGLFPLNSFTYEFKDQENLKNYQTEAKWKQIILFGAILSIFISCIGLFGLSVSSAEKRRKEIGIRKVLGASAAIVATNLSKDFLKLILFSMVIAMPIAWITGNKWLQNYPYRITLNLWMFASAGLLVIMIALITVSFQAIKAAIANPVKSLRTE